MNKTDLDLIEHHLRILEDQGPQGSILLDAMIGFAIEDARNLIAEVVRLQALIKESK